MRVHLTLKSSNVKTGPIPVSTSSSETCPPSCPFREKGCYAKGGPLAIHWAKVSNGSRGLEWPDFLQAIRNLPEGQLWRHNQAGDLAGEGQDLDFDKLFDLVASNAGKRGFTYSHKYDLKDPVLMEEIARSNRYGFTINLSANSLSHADELAESNCGPVCVVLPADQVSNTATPQGRKVIVCPATQRDDITCASCGLCQRADRSVIVGFPAHGMGKKTVSNIVK